MIIEDYTGLSLQEAYRRYVFQPSGMHSTWMEFLEDRPVGLPPLSRVYYGDTDYTEMKATTAGWGASGLASTLSDLDAFMRALVRGALFASPETWRTMTTWIPATGNVPNLAYGFGLFRVTGDYGEIIGHTGACKSVLNYWVDEDVTISATLNQWKGNSNDLVKGVLDILKRELPVRP
jgi:D-alanyl-D-alanine carboxypeptidase